MLLRRGHVDAVGVEGGGDEQLLRVHRPRIQCPFEFFVENALVRGVHVDEDQPVLVLGENVDPVQLRDRESERRRLVGVRAPVRYSCCGPSARTRIGEHRRVARNRLSEAQRGLPARGWMDWPTATGAATAAGVCAAVPERPFATAWNANWCTARGSRKRTSILAGWTLTSTPSGRSRGTARRPDDARRAARRGRLRAARARSICRARSARSRTRTECHARPAYRPVSRRSRGALWRRRLLRSDASIERTPLRAPLQLAGPDPKARGAPRRDRCSSR